jgi:hypothetical protein
MDQAKRNRQEIMERPDWVLFRSRAVEFEKVDNTGEQDRYRYQKLDEGCIELDDIKSGECQRNGMADGEAGHKCQHLPPIAQGIDGAEGQQKEHVVVGLEIKNMIKAQLDVGGEYRRQNGELQKVNKAKVQISA